MHCLFRTRGRSSRLSSPPPSCAPCADGYAGTAWCDRSSGLALTSAAGPEDLAGSGFHIRTDQTYLIDVCGGRDEVWTRLSSSARKSVRKTERDGIRIVPAARSSDILKRVVESAYGARGADSGYFFDHYPICSTSPTQIFL